MKAEIIMYNVKSLRFVAVLLLLLIFCSTGFSQSISQSLFYLDENKQQKPSPKMISLEKLIKKIESDQHIIFLYKTEWIKDKYVPASTLEQDSLKFKLGAILQEKGLTYSKITARSYVIRPQTDTGDELKEPVQVETVSGTVTDAESGETLPGVNVMVKGTANGTSTGSEGKFELEVGSLQDTLIFSFVGYKSQEIPIEGQTELNVEMEVKAVVGDELIVVGYGEQEKQTLVGSVGTIEGDDLSKAGSVNTISESLQGALPGLTAVNSTGQPGADAAELYIRGKSSWRGGGQPLTLVDGVERGISAIDPEEIESISVLKDASATAVYGVRGANGVILITTKRGRSAKPTFRFSSNFGFKEPTAQQSNAGYLTTMEMYNEAAANDRNWGQIIPESTIKTWRQNYDQRGPYNPYFPEINWFDELLGTGYQQNYKLNVRGGSDFIKYYAWLGYRHDGDIYQTSSHPEYSPSFGLDKYNWRANLDFSLTPTTELSVNFSGSHRERNQPAYRSDAWGTSRFFNRMFEAPTNNFPLTYPDGHYGDSQSGEHNMIAHINEGGERRHRLYQAFYDVKLNQKLDFLIQGLSFKGSIDYTTFANYEKSIFRSGAGGGGPNDLEVVRYYRTYDYSNPVQEEDGRISYPLINETRFPDDYAQEGPLTSNNDALLGYARTLNYRLQTNYKRNFSNHEVSGTAVMLRRIRTSRNGFANKREEWIGRVNYYYKDKYLLEFNGAYSGSEKFAPGLRFGFFPSFSAGWVISEEPFVQSISDGFLDFLKVTYSYGIVGSDNNTGSRFQYMQVYNSAGGVPFGYDNVSWSGPRYVEGTPANPNSTWEKSKMQNLGIRVELIDKIDISLDLFKEERTGILMNRRTQPAWFGTRNTATGNIGETKNRGYELEIGWKDKIGKDFNYYLNFSTAYSENRIVFRDDPRGRADYLKDAGKPIGWSSRLLVADYYDSLNDIYNGATPNHGGSQDNLVPGDLMYVDYNADGKTNSQDRVAMENITDFPSRTFGLDFGFSYKNWGLNGLLYGVTNIGYAFPDQLYWDFTNGFVKGQPNITDRWTPDNPEAAKKPALHLVNNHNAANSSLTYMDGSYLRLKNLEVSYKINSGYIKNLGLNNIQFYANGNNLITWTKLDDRIDPETAGTNTYPVVRRYNLGFRMSF